jgi:hypothetical protein
MMVALPFIGIVAISALSLVTWGTLNRNRWGLHFGKVLCPRCLLPIPPKTNLLRRILVGGGTCNQCHSLVDKWGRERMPDHAFKVRATGQSQK